MIARLVQVTDVTFLRDIYDLQRGVVSFSLLSWLLDWMDNVSPGA